MELSNCTAFLPIKSLGQIRMLSLETSSQTLPPRLTLSVIIPVRDGGFAFRRCLQAIAEAVSISYGNHRGGGWGYGRLLAGG